MSVARMLLLTCLLAWAPTPRAQDDARESLESSAVLGPVTAKLRLRPAAPRMGDVLELELEVRAPAGVELLMPEFGAALDRFPIVDFAVADEAAPDGSRMARQTYRLDTTRSGAQRIAPLAVEFVDRRSGERAAPEGADAYELLTEAIDFEVASVLLPGEPDTLKPAKAELGPRGGAVESLGWGLLVGLAALGGYWLWRRFGSRRVGLLRRSAYDVARTELDALLAVGRPSRDRMDPFFVSLSSIVRRYVESRFQLRSPELTTEEFLESMSDSPDLAREHQELLREFLRRADLVKFARQLPDDAGVDASIAAAERLLSETREREAPTQGDPGVAPAPEAARA